MKALDYATECDLIAEDIYPHVLNGSQSERKLAFDWAHIMRVDAYRMRAAALLEQANRLSN